MARALAEYKVVGVRTTIPVLARIVAHPDFRAGRLSTAFLERGLPDARAAADEPGPTIADRRHRGRPRRVRARSAAAARAVARRSSPRSEPLRDSWRLGARPGWRRAPREATSATARTRDDRRTVDGHEVDRRHGRPLSPDHRLEVWEVDGRLTAQGIYSLLVGGVSYVADVGTRTARASWTSAASATSIRVEEATRYIIRTRGGAAAAAPGADPRGAAARDGSCTWPIRPGDRVEKGDTLLVIEAMKMENEFKATSAGTIAEVRVAAGQAVNARRRAGGDRADGRRRRSQFQGVNKWFGKLQVLRDIDLAVAPGEVVVVCGPSGSGQVARSSAA